MGMTDMTVSKPLPGDDQSILAWVACLTGAVSPDMYVSILKEAGFTDFIVEDKREALLDTVNDIRRKLLGAELAIKLGKFELPGIDLERAKHLAQRSVELIEGGVIGYGLFKATKEE